MKPALKFPHSVDGTIEGISDAGIETFTGNPLAGLAREQAQNSIDARDDSKNAPVQISYKLFEVKNKQLPGFEDLLNSAARAESYWRDRCGKTTRVLKRAIKTLTHPKIYCLRISDRNTTGLTGSNQLDQGNWFNLTKASGVSEKSSGKGGSFGIGKSAFFANSLLRTVFFSTFDKDERWAFQGVTKLVSHKNSAGKITRGTGFYGDPEGYLPLMGKSAIPVAFRCDGTGTDIFVVGFDLRDGWHKELMAAFAENFFVAIHDNLLEISIETEDKSGVTHQINSATLGDIINSLANQEPRRYGALRDYYDALVSDEAKEFNKEIEGLGHLNLRLLKRDDANRKVAMFRRTGMKIFEKDRFRIPVEFAGVFRCLGEEGNALLRRLEPPSHDKWEPDRFEEDIPRARHAVNDIAQWIKDCVKELQVSELKDKESIPGLERLLPDDFEDPFDKASKAVVEGDPKSKQDEGVSGLTRPQKYPPAQKPQDSEDEQADDEGGTNDGDTGTTDGDGTRIRTGDTPRQPSDGEDGAGSGGNGQATTSPNKEIDAEYRTFFDVKTARYRMMAKFPSAGTYDVALFAVGDDGNADTIQIEEATVLVGDKERPINVVNQNRLCKIKVNGQERIEIRFTNSSVIPRALRARVYQNV